MSKHLLPIAALLVAAPVAAPAAPRMAPAEKKAVAECRSMTRGWDIKLPAGACQDPQMRLVAMTRAREACEKERMAATGMLRARRCPSADTH